MVRKSYIFKEDEGKLELFTTKKIHILSSLFFFASPHFYCFPPLPHFYCFHPTTISSSFLLFSLLLLLLILLFSPLLLLFSLWITRTFIHCIYFSYILISGGIPSMAHWCFWLSPSPQLFFSYSSVSLFHFIICL